MKSLFNSVLETAALFKNCDGHSHFERNREGSFNEILEELSHVLISCFAFIICADIPVEELTVEVDKKYNKYHCEKAR